MFRLNIITTLQNVFASITHTHGNVTNDGKIGSASGKIVTTGTNGALQASDSITKSMISDFPTSMTPASHAHGNITNTGAIGTASGKIITTTTNGVLQASNSITKSMISDFPTSMTPTSHVHGNITNAGAIGSASGKIVTTGTSGVLQASDSITKSMISDFPTSMTPASHTHGDITNAGAIGSTANLPLITTTNGKITTGSFGNSANTFCAGDDSRLSNSRTPTSHTHGDITNTGAIGSTANLPIITTTNGKLTTGSFGNSASTFCEGNDSRLSNARTPTSHTHGSVTNDGKIGSASGKIITTGTSGVLQASDSITKSMISDFPTSMTPASHTHGSLTNDGKIGSASGKIITTGTSGVLQASDSITKSMISDFPTSMTPASHTHGDITNAGAIGSASGKIVTTGTSGVLQASDSITKSMISDFPTSMTPASHAHGNITNDGKIGSTANLPLITTTSGKVTTGSFGNSANTFCAGDDSRLSNARTPTSHTHGSITNDGKIGSDSGKIITTGTGGVLQASSSITKSQISDFSTYANKTSVSYSNGVLTITTS